MQPPDSKKLKEHLQRSLPERLSSTQSKVRSRLATSDDDILKWSTSQEMNNTADKKTKPRVTQQKSQGSQEIIDVDALDHSKSPPSEVAKSHESPSRFTTPSSSSSFDHMQSSSHLLAERTRNADMRLQQMYPSTSSLHYPSVISATSVSSNHKTLLAQSLQSSSSAQSSLHGANHNINAESLPSQQFIDLRFRKHTDLSQRTIEQNQFTKESPISKVENKGTDLSSLYHLYKDKTRFDHGSRPFVPTQQNTYPKSTRPLPAQHVHPSIPSTIDAKRPLDENPDLIKSSINLVPHIPNNAQKPLTPEQVRLLQNFRLEEAAAQIPNLDKQLQQQQNNKPISNNGLGLTPEDANLLCHHIRSQQRDLERKLEELKELERRVNASIKHSAPPPTHHPPHVDSVYPSQHHIPTQQRVQQIHRTALPATINRKVEPERVQHGMLSSNTLVASGRNRVLAPPSSHMSDTLSHATATRQAPLPASHNLCPVCRLPARFICSGCHRVWYCSQSCQVITSFLCHLIINESC